MAFATSELCERKSDAESERDRSTYGLCRASLPAQSKERGSVRSHSLLANVWSCPSEGRAGRRASAVQMSAMRPASSLRHDPSARAHRALRQAARQSDAPCHPGQTLNPSHAAGTSSTTSPTSVGSPRPRLDVRKRARCDDHSWRHDHSHRRRCGHSKSHLQHGMRPCLQHGCPFVAPLRWLRCAQHHHVAPPHRIQTAQPARPAGFAWSLLQAFG